MSIAGLDFGNQSCKIACPAKGHIEMIANEASNRLNPTLAAFGSKQRFAGEAAASQQINNLRSTITNVKRVLGLRFSDPEVQKEIATSPNRIVPLGDGPDAPAGFEVQYQGETVHVSPERVVAMVLRKLKDIVEKNSPGQKLSDVVIGVPPYFTEVQRRAFLTAAKLADLNCLRLLNETTALALFYGFYKLDLPAENEKAQNVLFVDAGNSATVAAVVAFHKGKLKVLSTCYDTDVGGRNLDELLLDHFKKQILTKYKLDISESAKAVFRLRAAIEKLRHVLSSGVPQAQLSVESLLNDVDISFPLSRKELEDMAQPFLEAASSVAYKALTQSGLEIQDLKSLEIVGGMRRMPALLRKLADTFGREVSTTMNDIECVAKGCALQCAMLSPVMKVRDFAITDVQQGSYFINYNSADSMQVEDKTNIQELFPSRGAFPVAKYLKLKTTLPLNITATYAPSSSSSSSTTGTSSEFLGSYVVKAPAALVAAAAAEKKDLRLKFRTSLHSTFEVADAELLEVVEVDQPTSTSTTPPPSSDAKEATPSNKEGEAAAAAATPSASTEKKKKVKTHALVVECQQPALLHWSPTFFTQQQEEEASQQASDRLAVETTEARNTLESYVYSLRNKLYDALAPYAAVPEKDKLLADLDLVENWLYDEGSEDSVTKSVFVEKLNQLKKQGDPIEHRRDEETRRQDALRDLTRLAENLNSQLASVKYDHLTPEEKQQVTTLCTEAVSTYKEKVSAQDAAAKHLNPVLLAAEIRSKAKELETACNKILSKPKPKPATPPPAEQKPAETPNPNANNTENPANANATPAAGTEKTPQDAKMQEDEDSNITD